MVACHEDAHVSGVLKAWIGGPPGAAYTPGHAGAVAHCILNRPREVPGEEAADARKRARTILEGDPVEGDLPEMEKLKGSDSHASLELPDESSLLLLHHSEELALELLDLRVTTTLELRDVDGCLG